MATVVNAAGAGKRFEIASVGVYRLKWMSTNGKIRCCPPDKLLVVTVAVALDGLFNIVRACCGRES